MRNSMKEDLASIKKKIEIQKWMATYNINGLITDDFEIICFGDIYINGNDGHRLKKFPYKIKYARTLHVDGVGLESLENFPDILCSVSINDNNLTSLDGLPITDYVQCYGNPVMFYRPEGFPSGGLFENHKNSNGIWEMRPDGTIIDEDEEETYETYEPIEEESYATASLLEKQVDIYNQYQIQKTFVCGMVINVFWFDWFFWIFIFTNEKIKMRLNKEDMKKIIKSLPFNIIQIMISGGNENVYIAGGYIRSIITNTPVNDIDLFCKNEEVAREVCFMMDKEYRSAKVIKTNNAMTYIDGELKIQVIHRTYHETPNHCLNSFDFEMSKACVFVSKNYKGYRNGDTFDSLCSDEFYQDIATKRLTFKGGSSGEGLHGIHRMLKFTKQGYDIDKPNLDNVLKHYLKDILKLTSASPETIEKTSELVNTVRQIQNVNDYPQPRHYNPLEKGTFDEIEVECFDTDVDFEMSPK